MASPETIENKSPKIDGIDKWEVESAADTIARAMEIKNDKKLFKAALKVLKQKKKSTEQAVKWADGLV
jgi:hypothetical protein